MALTPKPLVTFDPIGPRKILMEKVGIPWHEAYNDWTQFKNALKVFSETFDEVVKAKIGNHMPWQYNFLASSSCGTIQLSSLHMIEDTQFARAMAWAVSHMAPNFIYMAGDQDIFNRQFTLLEDFGFLFVTRTWNPLHGHWCREYHLAYDIYDQKTKESAKLVDNDVYQTYYKMLAVKNHSKKKVELYVEDERAMPEVPQQG